MPGMKPDGYNPCVLGSKFVAKEVQPFFVYNTNWRTWHNYISAEYWPEDDSCAYGVCWATACVDAGSMFWCEHWLGDERIFQGYKVSCYEWIAPKDRIPFIRYPSRVEMAIYWPTTWGLNPQCAIGLYKYREVPIS